MRVLFLLLAAFAWADDAGPPKPLFPSDGLDPKSGSGAELLLAVCPGHVVTGDEFGCSMRCPGITGFHLEWALNWWQLVRVTRGHFLSPTSDDAVLWMEGCEPHAALFGGSILLTKRGGTWKMLWYSAGNKTDLCHKVALNSGREILACADQDGNQGYFGTALYIQDVRVPAGPDQKPFFMIGDSVLSCTDPLIRAYIERVRFGENNKLTAIVQYGKSPLGNAGPENCPAPPSRSYTIDFLFNGRTYKVAPWSAKTAAMVQVQP